MIKRTLPSLMVLILLFGVLPSAFAEEKPGAHDLEEIKSGIEYPRDSEYLDEYIYAVVEAPHGHSVFGYGSADRLGSRYSVKHGERVKILAERKGVSCVIVLSQKKGRWINSQYLIPEIVEESPEEKWVRLYDAYFSAGELTRETETTYNADGQVTENRIHEINRDGTEIWQVETFFNDEENRISRSEKIDQGTGEIVEYSVWQFNENGMLRQVQYFDAKGTLKHEQINTYYDVGSTIESIMYDDNGEVYNRYLYYRDINDNDIKYESFNEFGELNFIKETTYDANGRKAGGYEEGYGSKSTLKYIYDDEGILRECVQVRESRYSTGETRIQYSYDEHGNLTEELSITDGKENYRHISTWGSLNTGE